MNRRDLLKRAGAAIIPAAILGSRLPAMGIAQQPGILRIGAVVYDERYSDCRSFADILVRRGAVPFPVNGDCGKLWHSALREHLVGNGGSVAGLTSDSDSVVSRICGKELGLAAIYEGAHDCRGSDFLAHRLRGGVYQREIAVALRSDGACWAESLAQSLAHGRSHHHSAIFSGGVLVKTSRSFGHPGYLTSWLLENGDPHG